jgi:hypothetical protein
MGRPTHNQHPAIRFFFMDRPDEKGFYRETGSGVILAWKIPLHF